jgi:nitroreductase
MRVRALSWLPDALNIQSASSEDMARNLCLAATSMGLGACAVGAFLDDEFNGLLGLDGKEEAVLYVIGVGTT